MKFKVTVEDVAVHVDYDCPAGRGRVTLGAGHHGPNLLVDGVELGYVDLFPPTEGRPPQLLLFDPGVDDEAVAKVFLEDKKMVVVVNKEAEQIPNHGNAIHWDGDRVFRFGPQEDQEGSPGAS